MPALMVVYMNITDPSWIESYFIAVPAILADYGGVSVAAARDIRSVEGARAVPDRMAILSFPSLQSIDDFMSDERYQPCRQAREQGARSDIFVFENLIHGGELA